MFAVGETLDGPGGRYVVRARHGEGGSGVTWLADRQADGRAVIVKTLRLDRLPGWKAFDLFEREARVLRAVSHPGVPRWLDDFILGDAERPRALVLVMDLVPGRTLREITRDGGQTREQTLRCLEELLGILVHLHAQAPPVIHRDVTPKNVIIRPDGGAALVDFGSVQAALCLAQSGSVTAAGTFGYAAPEQFVGRATPAADLYGAGMTFLFAMTGREPSDLPIDGLRVEVGRVLRAEPPLVSLLQRMIEPDPRERLASAEEALRLLRRRPTTAPVAVVVGRATSTTVDNYLTRLKARLTAAGLALAETGEMARTRLAIVAHGPRRGLGAGQIHVYATRADWLEGAAAGKPPSAMALSLFAQAAGRVHAGAGGWRGLLGGRDLVVPVVVCSCGLDRKAIERLASELREPEAASVLPVLVDLEARTVEVVRPRSLLAGDPTDAVATARRLVDVLDDHTSRPTRPER